MDQKGTTFVVRDGPLYRENKNRFQGCVSLKTGGYYVAEKMDRGREFQSIEVIGIKLK